MACHVHDVTCECIKRVRIKRASSLLLARHGLRLCDTPPFPLLSSPLPYHPLALERARARRVTDGGGTCRGSPKTKFKSPTSSPPTSSLFASPPSIASGSRLLQGSSASGAS